MNSPQDTPSGSASGNAPDESQESGGDDRGPCPQGGYWSGEFGSGPRKALMLFLCLTFAIQTYLVYSDPTPQPPPLAGKALEGRRVWHENNCQSCHQFYGFGGFLGPDLTNIGPRLERSHLDMMLAGYAAMPAFDLTTEEVDALEAFLRAMNDTGVGQARAGRGGDPDLTLERVTARRLPDDETIRAGFEGTKLGMCAQCHDPFVTAPTGAPDMSTAHSRVGADGIREVITKGRGLMPALALPPEKVDEIIAFLQWMESERAQIKADYEAQMPKSIEWGKLPWWEYE